MSEEAIKSFVRDTLGCACPEEVFSHIEAISGHMPEGCHERVTRINIGHRLLVYVVMDADSIIDDELLALLGAGMNERDALGFNRFRLALVTRNRDWIQGKIWQSVSDADFEGSAIASFDQKVHLHVVDGPIPALQ